MGEFYWGDLGQERENVCRYRMRKTYWGAIDLDDDYLQKIDYQLIYRYSTQSGEFRYVVEYEAGMIDDDSCWGVFWSLDC